MVQIKVVADGPIGVVTVSTIEEAERIERNMAAEGLTTERIAEEESAIGQGWNLWPDPEPSWPEWSEAPEEVEP